MSIQPRRRAFREPCLTLLSVFADLALSPLPFDVRFNFPRLGRDLWANSTILKNASPYFKDMLDSSFVEAQCHPATYTGPLAEACTGDDPSWSDSDAESDPAVTDTPAKINRPIHSVTITEFCFPTYHAILVWILTKHITFSPFEPALEADDASDASEPNAPVVLRPARSAPPPVSPKSVYRLAHLVNLPKLAGEALRAFKENLTVDNVAKQLFSSTADLYDDIRAAAADFAVERWKEVEKTAAMREVLAKVDAREADQGGVVMRALAKASLAKASKA